MGDAIADLLTEAFTDPTRVIAEVDDRLPTATPSERCQLLRALGNACRELRQTAEATVAPRGGARARGRSSATNGSKGCQRCRCRRR